MELNSLRTVESHEAGAECNITSPVDGKPTDVFIKIKGADSKEWRNAKKSQTSQIIAARASGGDIDLDYDKMDIDALVAVTMGWRGIVQDGEEYACNKENARKLYADSPSVVSQLIDFLTRRANFTNG